MKPGWPERPRGHNTWKFRVRFAPGIAIALAAVLTGMTCIPVAADPHARLVNRDYRVYGDTERALVAFMKSRPFRGDHGPALANIRPHYTLKASVGNQGPACRVEALDLSIRFVLTLPRAMDADRFSARTRRVWSSFRAFTKRHEDTHRRIYLGCARRFLYMAWRLSDPHSCGALKRRVRSLLRQQERACDRLHDAFDRRELPRLRQLALFRMARLRGDTRRGAAPRSPGFGLRYVLADERGR